MNLLQIDINWPQLKALHEIYETGRTKAALFSNPYLDRLRREKRLLKFRTGNLRIIEGTARFKEFYQVNFLSAFGKYHRFFERTGVSADGRRPYTLYDLETLLYIEQHQATLKANLTTERSFAAQLFRSSKYFENNSSVLNAVLKILNIDSFPKKDPKDQQWRLVIDCTEPVAVVLCENLATLKAPEAAMEMNIELWYVGGNNTRILANLSADKLSRPIYYMGDWDYDGLRIFLTVKRIIGDRGAPVRLLMPYDKEKQLPVSSPYHNSTWKHDHIFSGLPEQEFEPLHVELIQELIAKDNWIEEESQDFKLLLFNNEVLTIL